MANSGYPIQGVYGYKSLYWALNSFIQADHEFESLPSWSEEAIERYEDAVESAIYLVDLIENHLNRHHSE